MVALRDISRFTVTAIIAMAVSFCAVAQVADSSALRKPAKATAPRFAPAQLIAPGVLMASGAAIHFAAHEAIDLKLNEMTSKWEGENAPLRVDEYARFVPGAMSIGLGILGAHTNKCLSDRVISAFWAYGGYIAVGYTIKALVYSPRPDLSDSRSFPSGHTGFAFTGAELVRMQYGWGWGAGAYAVATGVAAIRLYNNAHWMSDLLFGAGCGILCAHVGDWLLVPTRHLLGIDRTDGFSITARVDPMTGALCPSVAMRF